ncbi:MAG TPA: glycosyltransferase family 2 protein [Niabella sp.]|nr:glycosyltransferase family 2 protein [Chitinophagaceae bacterium]HUN02305.1 glycosyltransferase family 2 protein [Niabella sp.]
MRLSIISPVYKAEKIVEELVSRISKSVEKITTDYEIILVEDGSPDDSWGRIVHCARENTKIRGIKLSRNFGQHHAITAGLDNCRGDWVVVMDCDLQDQPEEIPRLYQEALKGYDIVYAQRKKRMDGFLKRLSSKIFYKLFSWLSGVPQDSSIANFGIYSGKAIAAINRMREPLRSFATMIKWVGFKSTSIEVAHAARMEGKTSYNFKKLLDLALDISLSFSDKPLRLTVKLGAVIAAAAFLFGIITVVRFFAGAITEPGYTSLIVSIWFLCGLMIFIIGVVGLYISKVFEGVKNRPLYIIEKEI